MSSRPFDLQREVLPRAAMLRHRAEWARAYRAAEPFPHVVIDDLFDADLLDRVIAEYPRPDQIAWERFAREPDEQAGKLQSKHETDIPPFTRWFLYHLNSATVLELVEAITGIRGLVSDPYFDGGGLHQTLPGGRLMVHADFNRHHHLRLDRRINAILYLNRDWREEYGGHLELWDAEMRACRRRILPTFNRLVIFGTTDFTYHGHPDPLTCPEGRTRKSLALYYFTNGRPDDEKLGRKHATLWRRRPQDTRRLGPRARKLVRSLLPPIVTDFLWRRRD